MLSGEYFYKKMYKLIVKIVQIKKGMVNDRIIQCAFGCFRKAMIHAKHYLITEPNAWFIGIYNKEGKLIKQIK